jgi:hypothetical protein
VASGSIGDPGSGSGQIRTFLQDPDLEIFYRIRIRPPLIKVLIIIREDDFFTTKFSVL